METEIKIRFYFARMNTTKNRTQLAYVNILIRFFPLRLTSVNKIKCDTVRIK